MDTVSMGIHTDFHVNRDALNSLNFSMPNIVLYDIHDT